jgi:osmotically-inducible protein OsmY
VKIISQDGVVTLRGSVKSEAEAKEVHKKAVAEAGQGRVQDHLEVSP